MRLVKILIAVLSIHAGLGFTQLGVSYFGGDIADYGSAGFVSHTPIGSFIDLEDPQAMQEEGQVNPSNLKAMFDFANSLGDTINGLASFGYGFLSDIKPEDGFVYTVVLLFRTISVLFWISLAMALIYFLFDSNLLTSKLGLAIVGLGVGLGSLSGIGALF